MDSFKIGVHFFVKLGILHGLKNYCLSTKIQKLLTYKNGKRVVIIYPLKKNQIVSIFFICLYIPMTSVMAFEYKDYILIETLVKRCYKDAKYCNSALSKINNYQRISAINKKLSCQTRLLGLEANLIMAMNNNLKRSEAKSIIKSVKKYC